jgi:hypothetical protein
MSSRLPNDATDRRATPTPGLDPVGGQRPDLPPPITADDVDVTPPDRADHPAEGSTDVGLTFERS